MHPNPEIVDQQEVYTVDAWRLKALRWQLLRGGPVGGDGATHSGLTSALIDARFTLDPSPVDCRLVAPQVRIEITTYLPEWKPQRKPVAKVVHAWEGARAALIEHEQGHRRHALAAADELLARLRELPAMTDCRRLDIAAQRVRQRVLTKLDARSRLYDQATDYGRHGRLPAAK